MNSFNDVFKKKAFIAFLTAGDPTIEDTEAFIYKMIEAGVSLIEIGIPFSDPIAEGNTIMEDIASDTFHCLWDLNMLKSLTILESVFSHPGNISLDFYLNNSFGIDHQRVSHFLLICHSKKSSVTSAFVPSASPVTKDPFRNF